MFSSSVSGAFSIRRPARFLLDVPELDGHANPVLVVALHGYAMNPTEMLGFTRSLLGPSPVIAALEGPNSIFLGKDPRATRSGFHWGTRETVDFHIDVHHQMVQGMIDQLANQFPATRPRRLLLGYSQSVGLNYRFVARNPAVFQGVVALCGGIPGNWDADGAEPVESAIFHLARTEDEFFPAAEAPAVEARLRRRAADVTFHMEPGRHRFPLKASAPVRAWVERVFPPQSVGVEM
ncbi:alpha/beta hydrolase [Paludibaculum fermentans]|uniref:alpha/beta hydrolase n=1 Tax=Paludibaculum fermentans TaxID=1473598 RepID=UPI003EBE50D3